MNLRKIILCSLFLAIGLVLHYITPPFLFGMKPDFLLAMMFICIVVTNDYKTTLLVGIVSGVLTAVTTTFPGGQIPNIIDKLVTSNFIFILFKLMNKKMPGQIMMTIISVLGTLVSGTVFLLSAQIIAGFSGALTALFVSVVLPASIVNLIACIVLYNAAAVALKHYAI